MCSETSEEDVFRQGNPQILIQDWSSVHLTRLEETHLLVLYLVATAYHARVGKAHFVEDRLALNVQASSEEPLGLKYRLHP